MDKMCTVVNEFKLQIEIIKLRLYLHTRVCVYVGVGLWRCVYTYMYTILSIFGLSILAQFRCGILPIKVETGRFTQIPQEFRLCILCDSNSVEDERHFLFECSFYEDIRNTFFHTVENLHSEFNTLNYENRFKLLMSIDVVKLTANFVYKIYKKRRDFIYNWDFCMFNIR